MVDWLARVPGQPYGGVWKGDGDGGVSGWMGRLIDFVVRARCARVVVGWFFRLKEDESRERCGGAHLS